MMNDTLKWVVKSGSISLLQYIPRYQDGLFTEAGYWKVCKRFTPAELEKFLDEGFAELRKLPEA